jgi:hypothetical protein
MIFKTLNVYLQNRPNPKPIIAIIPKINGIRPFDWVIWPNARTYPNQTMPHPQTYHPQLAGQALPVGA